MTGTVRPLMRSGGTARSTPGVAASATALVTGLGLVIAALVGGTDEWRGSAGLAAVGAGALILGAVGLRRYRVAPREAPATAFAALTAVLLTQIAVSSVAYLSSGTFTRIDDALFESVSGFSTTALTVVERPEELASSVVFWRAFTQWAGGLTALVAAGVVMPVLGVARGGDHHGGPRRLPLASRQTMGILRLLFRVYVVLTAVGIVLYAGAGMGPLDAVTYALTTISSGGLAHHTDGVAHFDSAFIEWAAVGGMLLAGVNLAVLFRAARGVVTRTVMQTTELRAFAAIGVALTALVVVFGAIDGDLATQIRHGAFSVVSMLSTTGYTVVDWGVWDDGAQTLLVLAAGVGAMSGAIGGGFRVARMLAVLAYIRREVVRQLHPSSVVAVKIGHRPIDEVLVDRIVSYMVLYLLLGGLGAVGLALAGTTVLTALTGALSALSTVGPAMGELTPGGGAATLDAPARAVLMPLMVMGRLELAPVLVGLGAIAREARRPAVKVTR